MRKLDKVLGVLVAVCLSACAHTTLDSPVAGTPKGVVGAPMPQMQAEGSGIEELLKALAGQEDSEVKVECPQVGKCVPKFTLNDVDEDSAKAAIAWMDASEKAGASALLLIIDSPGGSVDAGFKIIKAMEQLHVPVTCKVDGMAASMAFAILEGVGCSERAATKRSVLMAHSPGVGGNLYGGQEQFKNISEQLRVLTHAMAEQCAARMAVSVDTYLSRTTGGREWWMTPGEGIGYGALDKIE